MKGDTSMEKTRADNACAQLTSNLILMADVRGCYFTLEQPLASLMFKFSPIATVLDTVKAERIVTYGGAFGAPSEKPFELRLTNPTGCYWLEKTKRCVKRKREEEGTSSVPLTVKKGKWTDGVKSLTKVSAAYPEAMCKAISDMAETDYKNCPLHR
eukprot:1670328-Pyramimonas_sp.AAC.1